MFYGLSHVNRAVRILVGRDAGINERLYEAADEFEIALRRPDQWPKELLDRAIRIDRKLGSKGRISTTINGMDRSVAEHIAEEMLDLASAIHDAHVRCEVRGRDR